MITWRVVTQGMTFISSDKEEVRALIQMAKEHDEAIEVTRVLLSAYATQDVI